MSCLDQSNEWITWSFILNKKLSRYKLKTLNLLLSIPVNIISNSCQLKFLFLTYR